MRSVDLDGRAGAWDATTAALAIAAEAALPAAEPQPARRAGRRWVRRYERLALPPIDPAALPLRREGRYLITGGLGGMALSMARWLAREYRDGCCSPHGQSCRRVKRGTHGCSRMRPTSAMPEAIIAILGRSRPMAAT